MPPFIVHCDWSTNAAKRWQCCAIHSNGVYEVAPPVRVGPLDSFFTTVRQQHPQGPILVGFDFPIGLPAAYAEKAGITSFPSALLQFGEGDWEHFYNPATCQKEISLKRPFYPFRPGGTLKQHLTGALNLASPLELLRFCEHDTRNRSKACELFWTLGANQVGRAAIRGWRDLLAPALRANQILLWPFAGHLRHLLEQNKIVVAEAYPAETYAHIGLPRSFGKTKQQNRTAQTGSILNWCHSNQISLHPTLESAIHNGFGSSPQAEDMFDSFIGLLGLIEAAKNPDRFTAPEQSQITNIEGWILGMRQE